MYRLRYRLSFLTLVALAVAPWPVAAQTAVTLTWNHPSPSDVTGYRVSLDGVWHDYGSGPAGAGGACTCRVALSLATGSHTLVVAAYNARGETSSDPFVYTVQAPPPTTTPSLPGSPTAPSPVSGSTAASTSPMLTWSATGATTYDVKLDPTNPPLTAVAVALATPSYQRMLTAGTTYFWRIVARNGTGATTGPVWSFTTPSNPTAPGSGTVPTPWTNQDIGDVGVTGSATFSNGAFTVAGGGLDIWGTADAFQYVSHPMAGDGEIVAQVTALQNTHVNAKAGVMLRGSLDASAPHVMLNTGVDGRIELITRSSTGSAAALIADAMQTRPIWLKLTRAGSTVIASVSYGGQPWSVLGSTNVDGLAHAGLVVTSANPSVLNTSTFDSVLVSTAAVQTAPTRDGRRRTISR